MNKIYQVYLGNESANTLFLESEQLLLQTCGKPAQQLGQQIELFDYPAALVTVQSLLQVLPHAH